ncbi:sialate O-acetylesterase [Mycobacterium sp. NPDC006124]|uniref:sialate O-acetylesterase n=1 Tax=Mycobacterium sp. NPDC006124 TaxID=3156729 RepID=UPI0033A799CF
MWHQMLVALKCFVKRRIAPRGIVVEAPTNGYLIVPILGQSNAFGMGVGLDLGKEDCPHPDVHQWAMCGPSKGSAVLAVDPLLHEIPGKGVGFGVTFGRSLAVETGRRILLMPCARGDTSFTPKNGYTWDPVDIRTRHNLYRDAVSAIDAALDRFPGSCVAAILWHQGETDVPLTPGPVYREKLDSVIHDMRARYGKDVPFIMGQMVPEEMESGHAAYPVIDAVHADSPNRHDRVFFALGPHSAINGGFVKGRLDTHYNAAGQRELGRRMWAGYKSLCTDAPGEV